MIIAVDGPAASGKGTIARALATHYGLPHLDTGLLYRAVGVGVARASGDPDSPSDALAACAFPPELLADPDLRAEGAGALASRVSRHPEVRAALLAHQREFANRPGGAVLDGRDIGTVIAPNADAKLFVTASPEVRARRRHVELGGAPSFAQILADIYVRDARDLERAAAPLARADDADLLDTSELTIEEATASAITTVERRRSHIKRVPWPADFSEVIIHTDVRTRDAHDGYVAAKSGDPEAALQLAQELISDQALDAMRRTIGAREVHLLPVVAEEMAGFNAIPDAVAHVLGRELGKPVIAGDVIQTNRVGHTRARTFQRMVTPPTFAGPVIREADYVLVDDHVGAGSTLANLRGHIELSGGKVVAMTCLTEGRVGRQISLQPVTFSMLKDLHGLALDKLWRKHFGYGLDCLTEVEAQNLCRQPSVDAIEDFLAQAAIEARSRGLEASFRSSG